MAQKRDPRQKLTDRQELLLALAYLHGATVEDLSARFGVSIPTIEANILNDRAHAMEDPALQAMLGAKKEKRLQNGITLLLALAGTEKSAEYRALFERSTVKPEELYQHIHPSLFGGPAAEMVEKMRLDMILATSGLRVQAPEALVRAEGELRREPAVRHAVAYCCSRLTAMLLAQGKESITYDAAFRALEKEIAQQLVFAMTIAQQPEIARARPAYGRAIRAVSEEEVMIVANEVAAATRTDLLVATARGMLSPIDHLILAICEGEGKREEKGEEGALGARPLALPAARMLAARPEGSSTLETVAEALKERVYTTLGYGLSLATPEMRQWLESKEWERYRRLELALTALKETPVPPDDYSLLKQRWGVLPYKAPRTLEQIGQEHGITRERVRQREERALRRARNPFSTSLLQPERDAIRRKCTLVLE